VQSPLLLTQARLLDVAAGTYRDNVSILVSNGRIASVAEGEQSVEGAQAVPLAGRTVLPGLIDAHVHAIAVAEDLVKLADVSPYLVAAKAGRGLAGMLHRGFTTVRDAGGADAGLAEAIDTGFFEGPRLRVSGLAIAQSGGQGDFRRHLELDVGCPVCRGKRSITRVVDGVEEMRRACREELRRGAHQLKVMASGGIASGIPIDRPQFTLEELEAAVTEATRAGTYVMAHAYESRAINLCLDAGVRSIEHGTLMDSATADRMAAQDAVLVPTLAMFVVLSRSAKNEKARDYLKSLFEKGLQSLAGARAAGVRIGHGSDLDAAEQDHQLDEFRCRTAVLSNKDIICAATLGNARILMMEDQIGSIETGKRADILVYDGDPLTNIEVICQPQRHLRAILKDGRMIRNNIATQTGA
jgi:imidazolonepropionase-like amidohydrolase